MVDTAVWQRVSQVLSHPEIIAAEVSRHREDGGLQRDLAALDVRRERIATKQSTLARRITHLSDEAAEPVLVELELLATAKKAVGADRAALLQRIADADAERVHMMSLSDWCQTVSQNLEKLSYDERRLALAALGVKVRAFRRGTTDGEGRPYPRWKMTMSPNIPEPGILYSSTR